MKNSGNGNGNGNGRTYKYHRVVVTGMGMVSPVGNTVAESWQNILAGRSGIGPITRFPLEGFSSQIAGEVKGFHEEDFLSKKESRNFDLFVRYAVAASQMAMDDAGLKIPEDESARAGVVVGSGIGGIFAIAENAFVCRDQGPRRVSPFFIPSCIINMAPGVIAMRFGARGPNMSVVTACAAGTHSIGEAYRQIQRGDADIMIAGGAEAALTPLAVGGFCSMRALSTRNDDPLTASRPFDKDRDGFVIAEGAGVVVLESLEHAQARGAKIHGEVVGFGMSCDAHHFTAPNGLGARLCLEAVLRDSGLKPEAVDYINAHGTSTPLNDICETEAIKEVFGPQAYKLAVSSTKSMTGHLLGAAGAVEAIFTLLALKEGVLPPTINHRNPDPQCDLDYVPGETRTRDLRFALSNSFGFGGTNASLALARFEGDAREN